MAQMMIDDHQIKAAQLWIKVAEEKLHFTKYETPIDLLDITKEKVSIYNIAKEIHEVIETLCKQLRTTVHEDNFKSSSIPCRFVQEDGIPFLLRKFEDLSEDPQVYLIHDFFSKQEADDFMKSIENVKYAPNIVKLSTYVPQDDEKDPLGELLRILIQR